MPKKILLIILTGLVLRLAIMPFTSHPDLRGHYLGAYFIAKQGQLLGVYDYISTLPRNHPFVLLYHDDFLVYSPLTYLVHAAWLTVANPIIPWSVFEHMEVDMTKASQESGFSWLIFLLKVPYLIADVICLILLLKLVTIKNKVLAVTLWAFNLPILHSAFLMGQFDIFILLSLLFALYFSERNKSEFASVALALGAGFKPFSLFLLPLLPGKQIKNILIGGLTYLCIIAPYTLFSPGFRMYALVAQHSDKLWYAKVLVSGSQYLPLFFTALFILIWLRRIFPKSYSNLGWLCLPLLAFYSFTHFHPQWSSWVSGFFLLLVIRLRSSWQLILAMMFCYILITLSFEPSLSFGLFNIDYSLQPLLSDQFISAIRGLLAASAIVLAIKMRELKD